MRSSPRGWLVSLLTFALLLTALTVPFGGTPAAAKEPPVFSDVPVGTQFYDDIVWLASTDIATGWPDGTYRPLASVNRDAMAAFFHRMTGSPHTTPPHTSPFSDLTTGTQFYKEISWLAQSGITTGWADGTFRPVQPIARDAMAAFLYRLARQPEFVVPEVSPFKDVAADDQFYKEITWLASTGITTGWGDGTFRPLDPVARDAMAAFLHRFVTKLGAPAPTLTASVSGLTETTATLSWVVPTGATVVIRRTEGSPAANPIEGSAVATMEGSTVTDEGLTPGTRYHYSIWVDQSGTSMAGAPLYGPLVMTLGTRSPTEAASYVAVPETVLPEDLDIASATNTETGLQLVLRPGSRVPGVGAAVILPDSATLPGGYLGRAVSVSPEGTQVDLVPAGVGDAFDYYKLEVPDLSALPIRSLDAAAGGEAVMASTASSSDEELHERPTREQMARDQRIDPAAAQPAVPAAAALKSCLGLSLPAGEFLDFTPTQPQPAGHFSTEWSHGSFLGVSHPNGVWLDAQAAITLGVTFKAQVRGGVSCALPIGPLLVPLPGPAPISLYFNPTVGVEVEGGIDVENLGMTSTTGFSASGYLGLGGENTLTATPVQSFNNMTPKVGAIVGSVGLNVAGELYFGPAAGGQKAGALVGIGGELTLLNAKGTVTVPANPAASSCLRFEASGSAAVRVTARAWLGPWSGNVDATLLSIDWQWLDPTHFPKGCQIPPPDPSKDVLGQGVTKTADSLQGSPSQWGHLTGLDPAGASWVLSTGHAADAVNAPSFFASSEIGTPGNDRLSALSNYPTYDAAAYSVTVVPSGSTLKVRYVFASEEYPEYVGSAYNDVMAVWVGGTNCANVPGTSTPVAVNTVNSITNASYFRPNESAEVSDSVAYDGLTTPLTCSVPVTPGEPVTVTIAVADASDAVYDSAIALLDGGIWSE